MLTLFSSGFETHRRLIAPSSCHGIFVAPRTRTPVSSCPTPFIWTRNSVLILREPSVSESLRVPANESISSMKIIAGFDSRASSNKFLTNLSGPEVVSFVSNPHGGEHTFRSHPAIYWRGRRSWHWKTCSSPLWRQPLPNTIFQFQVDRIGGYLSMVCVFRWTDGETW